MLTSGLGEISSPNFPNYYNHSDSCAWLIMQPEGYRVNVSYTINTIKKGQSRETGNIVYTSQRKTKQKHNTICVGHHYVQTNTNSINKTCAILQTTGGKDEPNIVFMWKS